jgi:hypothetical protein
MSTAAAMGSQRVMERIIRSSWERGRLARC